MRTILGIVVAGLLSVAAATSLAAPIASFDFGTSGELNGVGGGTGWSGTWSSATTVSELVSAPANFNFSITGADTISAAGAIQFTGNSGAAVNRSLSGPQSGDVYFSFLTQWTAGVINDNDFNVWYFNSSGGPNIGVKANEGPASRDFVARNTSGSGVYSTDQVALSETNFVVGRLFKSGGGIYNRYSIWVNPAFADSAAPEATETTASSISSVTSVGVRSVNLAGLDSILYGNLRLGTAWEDVVPFSPTSAPGGAYVYTATTPGLTLTLDGSGSTDNVGIATYEWNISDDGGTPEKSVVTATTSMTLAESGLTKSFGPGSTNTVRLTVIDDFGHTGEDTANISYTNTLPTLVATGGTTLTFSANGLGTVASQSADVTAVDGDLAANATVGQFETLTVTWSEAAGPNVFGDGATPNHSTTSNAISETVTFAEAITAGLTSTTATGVQITVDAADNQNVATPAVTFDLTYSNDPVAFGSLSQSTTLPQLATLTLNFDDNDLEISAALAAMFEIVDWELDTAMATVPGDIGTGPGVLASGTLFNGTGPALALVDLSMFGIGEHEFYLNFKDSVGGVQSQLVQILVTPEPHSIAVWMLLGLVGVGCTWWRRRRHMT